VHQLVAQVVALHRHVHAVAADFETEAVQHAGHSAQDTLVVPQVDLSVVEVQGRSLVVGNLQAEARIQAVGGNQGAGSLLQALEEVCGSLQGQVVGKLLQVVDQVDNHWRNHHIQVEVEHRSPS